MPKHEDAERPVRNTIPSDRQLEEEHDTFREDCKCQPRQAMEEATVLWTLHKYRPYWERGE